MRAVAGSWHDVRAAQTWVSEARGPDVSKENLRDPGALVRLDMMTATDLLEKCPFLVADQSHGHPCQIEGRLLTGREMLRALCVWCSVRSESGQHWICRDLLKLTVDR
eukprot:7214518-Pyramimonas_sp.AAC.1